MQYPFGVVHPYGCCRLERLVMSWIRGLMAVMVEDMGLKRKQHLELDSV